MIYSSFVINLHTVYKGKHNQNVQNIIQVMINWAK